MVVLKYILVLFTVLMVALACSSTPAAEERVIVVTATPTLHVETEPTSTLQIITSSQQTPTPRSTEMPGATIAPQPTSAPIPTATPRPTATPLPTATPHPTSTPRSWPFSDSEGDWFVSVEKDPLTDREKIFVGLESTSASGNYLAVRCGYDEDAGDEAELIIGFDDELEGNVWVEVQYRFDDGDVETEDWALSNTMTGLFSESPTEFTWRIMHSQKLAVREEGGRTLVFDVDGLAARTFPDAGKV